jgi:uncharacterized protein DUF6868
MNLDTMRTFFLWCSILNYAILILWVLIAIFAREPLARLHNRLFRLTPAQLDMLNIAGITLYKMAVLIFNIVPCIVLYLMK